MAKLKTIQQLNNMIIHFIERDAVNADELVDILEWSLKKAKAYQVRVDAQNENDLNALENQTYEG